MENNFDRFEENIDLFDAYLQAEMTPEERVAFEARLATDPIFSKEFDLHHALLASMERNWEREKLRELVQTAVEQNEQKLPRNERSWRWWIVAVILLLLFVIGVLFFIQKNEPIEPTVIPTPPTAVPDTLVTEPVDTGSNELLKRTSPPVVLNKKKKEIKKEYLMGAGEPDSFSVKLPVHRFVVKEEKLERFPVNDSLQIFVFSNKSNTLSTQRSEYFLNLHIPENQFSKSILLQLFELSIEDNSAFYLQIGDNFYEIPIGDKLLTPITDKNKRKWLKK